MNRRDISNINDIIGAIMASHGPQIFTRQLNEADEGGADSNVTIEQLYSYGPEQLRTNHFTEQGAKYSFPQYSEDGVLEPNIVGKDNIVLFFTEKVSDSDSDLLHNATGPAVIFNQGGEGNEYYFIHGVQVEPDSKEWRAANAQVSYTTNVQAAGDEVDMSGFDFFK